ncbi:methyltransferase domain-containing protein [uncultured Bradyrhizobium sp.]|uniref:methyltransferase domain-containing protein n=1 Tax=uncultured Bradyrhizobium sp. TaxID=199684 RepID=UPI0035CA90FB
MKSIDSIYYRDAGSIRTARGVSARARKAMYDLFISEFAPDHSVSILDIGVSEEDGLEANMLEQQYPWPGQITCAGLGDGAALRSAFPKVSYVSISAGERLPFQDGQFDIVCSNAVLEHVGGPSERAFFLAEAQRVASSAFITVPNGWFPIEHHTAVPLLHWNPKFFRFLLKRTRFSYWTTPRNVEFLSEALLAKEWKGKKTLKICKTGMYLGPLSSNLALIIR